MTRPPLGSHPSATRLLLALALVLMVSPVLLLHPGQAHATDPPEGAEAAHRLAVKYYGRGDVERALQAWREADRLAPNWKYAFNIASALIELSRPAEAWEANARAIRYGVPEAHRTTVDNQRQALESELIQTHAWIELRVTPPDATVTRNGRLWPAPRRGWTAEPASTLVVAREGYESQELRWEHPRGERSVQTLSLVKQRELGRLAVEGGPAGAIVTVRGTAVGTLPRYEGDWAPGDYAVSVTLEGHETWRNIVSIRADTPVLLRVTLAPARAPVTTIVDQSPGPSIMGVAKWTSLGLAIAAGGVAGGLFGLADSEAEDLADLNTAAGPDNFETYRLAYAQKRDDYDAAMAGAWAMVAIAAGSAIASVTLFVLDADEETADKATPIISPVFLPGGGAAALSTWQF